MVIFHAIFTSNTPDIYLLLPLAILGVGISYLIPAIGSGTVGKLSAGDLAEGMAQYMSFRQLGSSVGVAACAILITWPQTLHSERLYSNVSIPRLDRIGWLQSAAPIFARLGVSDPSSAPASVASYVRRIASHEIDTLAFADVFVMLTVVAFIGVCVSPLIPRQKK